MNERERFSRSSSRNALPEKGGDGNKFTRCSSCPTSLPERTSRDPIRRNAKAVGCDATSLTHAFTWSTPLQHLPPNFNLQWRWQRLLLLPFHLTFVTSILTTRFIKKNCAKYHLFCCGLVYQYKIFKNDLNLTIFALFAYFFLNKTSGQIYSKKIKQTTI